MSPGTLESAAFYRAVLAFVFCSEPFGGIEDLEELRGTVRYLQTDEEIGAIDFGGHRNADDPRQAPEPLTKLTHRLSLVLSARSSCAAQGPLAAKHLTLASSAGAAVRLELLGEQLAFGEVG